MKPFNTSLAALALTLSIPVSVAVPVGPAMALGIMDCWGLEGQAQTDCFHAVAQEIACQASEGNGPDCPEEEEAIEPDQRFTIQPASGTSQRPVRMAR